MGLIFVLAAIGLFAFDQYMKATWDDHIIVTGFNSYKVKTKDSDHWIKAYLDKEKEKFHALYDVPKTIEIKKIKGQYILVSEGNQVLTKTEIVEGNGARKYAIYTNKDKSINIKILTNLYEWNGCNARQRFWSSGNLKVIKETDNGDRLRSHAHIYFYEHPIQYFLCYNLWSHPIFPDNLS